MSIEDQSLAYIDFFGYHIVSNSKICEKISSHFDYCTLGGRFVNNNLENVAPYQKAIKEYGKVGTFVLCQAKSSFVSVLELMLH